MFVSDIEAISKSLYLENSKPTKSLISSTYQTPSGRSKSLTKTPSPDPKSKPREASQKEKRSIWNWRPLKAFSRSRRFKCSFHAQVHSIQGLPSGFNGASFRVHWKRRDGELVTSPAKVSGGVVEFEERLEHICRVHGSRSGTPQSAKYEAKHFFIYATMGALPDLDLGKHRVDLTRLLPLTFEELEGEKSSGKWETSFKLSGKASRAVMNVSFGYSVIGDKASVPNESIEDPGQGDDSSTMSRSESLPSLLSRNSSSSSQSTDNFKDLHRSELATSLITLYRKFDEDKLEPETFTNHVEPAEPNTQPLVDSDNENGCEDDFEFTVIEKGIEWSSNSQEKSEEVTVVEVETENGAKEAVGENEVQDEDEDSKVNDLCTKESLMKDLESALKNVTKLEVDLDSLDSLEEDMNVESDNASNRNSKSPNYNDVTESEFLKMLGIDDSSDNLSSESEIESPREHMLRQFEKDTQASTCSPFAVETDDEELELSVHDASSGSSSEILAETFGPPSVIQTVEVNSNIRAKTLEDLETEALMSKWGLNENVFQYSPPKSSDSLVVELLPPLGKGLGSFLHTKGGGFVRSLKPSVSRDAKSGGSLVMQVSRPVVVPAKVGSGVMEILQGFASIGIEKLSMITRKLMPLEDITGKTMQQIAHETIAGHERQHAYHRPKKYSSSSERSEMGFEYVFLEDLAPLAADKMEELSIEGLRIQSGMLDDEVPSTIRSKSIGGISTLHGKGSSNMKRAFGLQGAVGLQLLDLKDEDEDNVDGLMGLSLTLDEWVKLDCGENRDVSERTSKVLAAYNANGKGKCGLLGNNFTLALMVQLRDPLRNYEPVGAPMISLIQVERKYSADLRLKAEMKDAKGKEEGAIPQFKITQVHIAGSETEPGKKKLLGSSNQPQSGSHWLLANGMGKNNITKSKVDSTKAQNAESLWSISSRTGVSSNPHIRNPNVLFRNAATRLS